MTPEKTWCPDETVASKHPAGCIRLNLYVASVLESPRRRRRLFFALAAVGILVPLIVLGVRFSSPGSSGDANGPEVSGAYLEQAKNVPFTPEKKRAVRRVLARFISTAVARKDVAGSWAIAGPTLRSGFTREQWSTGEIPVTPYPASRHGQGAWDVVEYSYPKKIGLEVLVFPKPRSGYSVATADVDVVKGHDGQWRVDYWMITKFHGPGAAAPADSTSALSEGPPNVHSLPGKKNEAVKRRGVHRAQAATASASSASTGAHAGAIWLAVPAGIVGLIVILPLSIGVFIWLRNRRAAAEYERSRL
jgi:hypothetical protein